MMKRIRVIILGGFVSAILAWPALAAQQTTPAAPPQPAAQSSSQPQSQTPQQNQQSQPAQAPQPPSQASSPSQPAAADGAATPSANGSPTSAGTSNSTSQPQASPSQAPPAPPPDASSNGQPAPQGQPSQPKEQPKPKPGSWQDVDSIGNRNVGKGLDMYSLESEIALGKQAAQEVERTSKLVDDPIVVEYINRVGQNLVRNSDAKVPFTIKVIDSDTINAFALPGGFFYVNSGLILAADTEAELAGVMGHEIAHVCARHATKNATKLEIMQLATIPLILLGPGGWAGYGIYEGSQLALPMSYLKFSRDDERQADYLGLQYMYKAGYDPNAFVSFFEKIEAEEKRNPGTIPKLFADHPPTPDRMEAAQREIATILPPRDQYIVTTSEFDMVKARLRRIENRQKVQDNRTDRPTLRTRTERQGEPGQAQPGQSGGDGSTASSTSSDDPDRPVLKKRTEAPDNSGTNNGGTNNGGSGSGGTDNGAGGSSTPTSTPSTPPSGTPSTPPSGTGTPAPTGGGGTAN
jgi:Zn-dependent protease with chaperone function